MPRLDGFGLLAGDPRRRSSCAACPCVLLSARAGEESRIEGLDAGADDYVIKPFSARELLARVGALLELRHMRRTAEEAFRLRTAQYETLLNEAPLGVYPGRRRLSRSGRPTRPRVAAFGDIPDLIGRDFDEVIRRCGRRPTPTKSSSVFRHTLETGEPYFTSGARREASGSQR